MIKKISYVDLKFVNFLLQRRLHSLIGSGTTNFFLETRNVYLDCLTKFKRGLKSPTKLLLSAIFCSLISLFIVYFVRDVVGLDDEQERS